MADDFAYGEKGDSLGIADSRAHPRTQVRALAYIELSDDNAGLILNISEGGLAVQAVQVVTSEHLPVMRFRLPKTDVAIEVAGKMVWQLRSRKEAGIQFVELSEEARAHIRDWIAAESSRLSAPEAPVRQRVPQREKSVPLVSADDTPAALVPPVRGKSRPSKVVPSGSIPPPPTSPSKPAPHLASSVPLPEVPMRSREVDSAPSDVLGALPRSASLPHARAPALNVQRSEQPPMLSPFPGVPDMPRRNSYVAPGERMEFKRPRWWTYTAALGIIAALGFAGLMIIDPGTISRAHLSTSSNRPDATSGDSTANVSQPVPPQPAPAPTYGAKDNSQDSPNAQQIPSVDSSSSVAPDPEGTPHKPPTTPASENAPRPRSNLNQRAYSSNQGSSRNAATGKRQPLTPQPRSPVVPVNPLSPGNSASDGRSETSASAAVQPRTVQPQPTTPTPYVAEQRASASAVPSNSTSSGSQPPIPQRDQDAYAKAAKRDQDAYAAAASQNRLTTIPSSAPPRTTSPPSKPQESSVELSPTQSAPVPPSVPLSGVPSGSVGATSQFHAIRIPPELKSKAAQLAGNLQIGQMLSSYSPAYPIEAARQGVEGIVKLDVIVAPNGTVETVQVLSGPAILTGASVSAVKQWRYGETLLGSEAIEAEQYVTLVFRLAK